MDKSMEIPNGSTSYLTHALLLFISIRLIIDFNTMIIDFKIPADCQLYIITFLQKDNVLADSMDCI